MWRFVNTVSRTSKKSWWRRCSSQHVRICDLICSNGLQLYLTIIKLHEERIRHLYDIDIIVQIILTLVPLYRVTIFWPSGRLKKVDPFRTWAFGTHSTAFRATCTRYFNNFMARSVSRHPIMRFNFWKRLSTSFRLIIMRIYLKQLYQLPVSPIVFWSARNGRPVSWNQC